MGLKREQCTTHRMRGRECDSTNLANTSCGGCNQHIIWENTLRLFPFLAGLNRPALKLSSHRRHTTSTDLDEKGWVAANHGIEATSSSVTAFWHHKSCLFCEQAQVTTHAQTPKHHENVDHRSLQDPQGGQRAKRKSSTRSPRCDDAYMRDVDTLGSNTMPKTHRRGRA